jgi:hypothetical protein
MALNIYYKSNLKRLSPTLREFKIRRRHEKNLRNAENDLVTLEVSNRVNQQAEKVASIKILKRNIKTLRKTLKEMQWIG